MEQQRVRLERDGDIAVIVIDNPPINAGSAAVREGLMSAIATVRAEDSLRGAVLIGASNTFIAGSDLREFGQPLAEPQLPTVIRAIEDCGKPVVAALHGAALGGGFELALGCDARIAAPGTVVGLPEVTLGIIPGAGGTQRLPRIVGIPRAIGMICSGERINSAAALAAGLIDAEAAGDLRSAAVAHARQLAGKQRLRDRAVPAADAAAVAEASAAALKAGKRRPQVQAAIDAIVATATVGIEEGLSNERAVFQRLRVSREAFALRHQFFAERDSAKHPALGDARPRDVRCIAVIGAGTMGSGIAIAALDAGYEVLLLEQEAAALDRGASRIHAHYASRVKGGKVNASVAAACEARLSPSLDWPRIAEADLVIEAVFEEMGVKQQVFQRIDALARPGAVLASNTSYLDLDAIAASTSRPQDVIGLHFFSPANVMKLMEVVRGKASALDALATGLSIGRALKKLPVLTGNAFGFVGNRLYAAYRRQCEFMVEEGAAPEQVDAALEAFGFAMGPFAVADLSGLDIAWRMRQAQVATREPAARHVHIADRLCEAGRLGRKTGAGYYRYPEGASRPQIDPAVTELIAKARSDKGIVPRELGAAEIQRRVMLTLVNEAALLLAEGVAERATDVDVVLVNGYGFPRWEGGPVFWARERGAAALQADLRELAAWSGPGFVPGDVQHVLNVEG
ncbi:3-hydroxyacyl-CoA dehydrogenase NAD-binding domain-containing protein [Ideonella azotifigens]|uniref:3-hydroxyacyl-CoA dehydrogenase NAD-binding domain-containing protein n=3 Tax=Ideonella azotifigens TaxID=513160 RepID=A0ABN1KKV0_9BURK|nr:3-hydroxyacyl-CoA dehydrogenase NAD-binding domain-containing protein [Ideonella azotifigens]MCD2339158.1 3-hydroxyacyl-CoA dehydrogenase NAD-binding domain-containing protein [Ideonella azotifigens]